jgi:hypothetical protein
MTTPQKNMKTKRIKPWNLREGDRIVIETLPRDMARDGAPRDYEVTGILKTRGVFTGGTLWKVKYADGQSPFGFSVIQFHGKKNNLPSESVTILI